MSNIKSNQEAIHNTNITGVCLHTFAVHPDHLSQKNKSINYYGVIADDTLFVTLNNKGDYYSMPVSELGNYNDGDTYVSPWVWQPLPEETFIPDENKDLRERISAAYKSWKAYYRGLKANLYAT